MAKYKIKHEREDCIGCGACAAICEKFWEMNSDGKSDLIGSQKDGTNEILEIEEKDFEENLEAAESCPVNVIHIKNLENDEDLI